jgi:hypothetical protein
LSSSRRSPDLQRHLARLAAVVGGAALLLTACGDGAEVRDDPEPVARPDEDGEPDAGSEREDDEPLGTQDLLEGRLAFLDADPDTVRRAVEPYDGVIELEVPEIGAVQVAFPVDTRRELLGIRDELRDAGHEVDVVLVADPHGEGSAEGGPALGP